MRDAAVARHAGPAALRHAVPGFERDRRRTQVRAAAVFMLAKMTATDVHPSQQPAALSFIEHALCGGQVSSAPSMLARDCHPDFPPGHGVRFTSSSWRMYKLKADTHRSACAPIVFRISAVCRSFLGRSGGARDMAALVLGRLLTRPDTAPALRQFVDWAAATLASCPEEQAAFLVPGALSPALNEP